MNYYKRHLGDYAKDAGHLSMLEHGAYTLLLDRYYAVERPIPTAEAYKVCRAREANERETVDAVLAEFFTDTPDGWTNKRADQEIATYKAKAVRNQESGKKGGRPPKSETQTVSDENPNGFQTETQTVSKNNPSHKPLATSQKDQELVTYGDSSPATPGDPPQPLDDGLPVCPHRAIIELYNAALPTLPRVREWTPARQQALRVRWREKPERQSLAWWEKFFRYVEKSDFLTGRCKRGNGHDTWECSLPWLLKAENFAKVIEGHYENRGQA